jgi:hypothetical protein
MHRDRYGTLWLGTRGGALSRFDDKRKTFVNYTPVGWPERCLILEEARKVSVVSLATGSEPRR